MGNKHSNTGYSGGHSTGTRTAGHTTGATTTTGHHDTHATHGHKKQKGAMASSLFWTLLNFLIFATICGLVGHLFNTWANGNPTSASYFTRPEGLALLFFSLLAAAVGLATTIIAVIHGVRQSEGAKHGTLGANLISFALTAIAFCFACKAIHSGIARSGGNQIKKEITAVAALDIIALATLLMYLMQLGLFKSHRHDERLPTHYETRDPMYNNGATGGVTTQPKTLDTHHTGTTTTTGPERAYHA